MGLITMDKEKPIEMSLQSICQNCHVVFKLKKKDINLVNKLQANGQKFIMLECPECGLGTHFVNLESVLENPQEYKVSDNQYRCPTSHCTGWVCNVHEGDGNNSFWGCGECGRIWPHIDLLFDDIKSITHKVEKD